MNFGYQNNYAGASAPPPYMNPMYNGAQPGMVPPVQAFGMYGQAMQPMSYEQMMNYRQTLIKQRDEYNRKMLKERYPVKYAIAHATVIGLLSVAAIAIQIVMIVNRAPNYFVGSGIWAGCYFLICAGLTLLLIQYRNYCLFVVTLLLNFFGFMVGIGGMVIVNVIGATSSSCRYSFYSTCTETSNAYNIVMIVIGVILVISSITFMITMQCLLQNGQCNNTRSNFQQVSFHANAPLQTCNNMAIY